MAYLSRENLPDSDKKKVMDFARSEFQKNTETISSTETTKSIRKTILDTFNVNLPANMMQSAKRSAISQIERMQKAVSELDDNIEDRLKYDIEGNDILLYTTKVNHNGEKVRQVHKLPIDIASAIVRDYVRLGSNLSGGAIINKYNLNPKVWNAMKTAFNLTKDSSPIFDIALKIAEDEGEDVDEIIEASAFSISQDKYRQKVNDAIARAKEKQYSKAITEVNKLEYYLGELSKVVQEYKPSIELKPIEVLKNDRTFVIACGDMHAGRTTAQVQASLEEMYNTIIENGAGTVNILNIGDNLESPILDGMHVSQNKEIEVRGRGQIMLGVELRENFFKKLNDAGIVAKVSGITGNHGRGTKNKDDDPERLPELAMYEILKSRLNSVSTSVEYFIDYIATVVVNDVNYIMAHGDYLRGKTPEQIIVHFGKPGMINVIVYGHLHNPEIWNDLNSYRIRVPTLNASESYGKQQVVREAKPGFVSIVQKKREKTRLDITFHDTSM